MLIINQQTNKTQETQHTLSFKVPILLSNLYNFRSFKTHTMAFSKGDQLPLPPPPPPPPCYYSPLPPEPPQNQEPAYIILPVLRPTTHRFRRIIYASILIILGILVYMLWPCDPKLNISRLRLNHIQVHMKPHVAIDISMLVTIKVHNVDVYYMGYDMLDVGIGYRGKMLGHVKSDEGHVRARGSSFVDAEIEFNGVEVLGDLVFLLEDLAKGAIPFDAVMEVNGKLGLFFFKFPLKTQAYCDVLVSTVNRTIIHQSC